MFFSGLLWTVLILKIQNLMKTFYYYAQIIYKQVIIYERQCCYSTI